MDRGLAAGSEKQEVDLVCPLKSERRNLQEPDGRVPVPRPQALVMIITVVLSVVLLAFCSLPDAQRSLLWLWYCVTPNRTGLAALPGSLEDARILRFIDGVKVTEVYRRRWGPIYRVFCGGPRVEVVLTRPGDIRAYYKGDGKVHLKSQYIGFGHYIGRVLGQAVGLKHNEDWRRIRGVTDQHFTSVHAIDLIPSMAQDMTDWLATMTDLHSAALDTNNEAHGQPFQVNALLLTNVVPFKLIARRLFSSFFSDAVSQQHIHWVDEHGDLIA